MTERIKNLIINLMKKVKYIIILLLISNLFFARDKVLDKIISDNILDISIEAGAGLYIGDFYEHLKKKGAYVVTPALDVYLSIYFLKYFGIMAMAGSGCIIHPNSYPIEGTLLYMGLDLFGQYDFKHCYIKAFAGAGFEHPTMFLQYYASAFFEAGTGVGVKINDYLYWYTSFKYRMGFLHSVLIYYWYNLDNNDTLMSVTFSTGIVARIKKIKK